MHIFFADMVYLCCKNVIITHTVELFKWTAKKAKKAIKMVIS